MPPTLRAAADFGIAYRAATPADLPLMAELYASTRQQELAETGWPDETKRAFLAQQFDAQHRHYTAHYSDAEQLIVERGGVPIGRLYLSASSSEVRIVDISLFPASRGTGLGGAILRDVLEDAREKGQMVSLHVVPSNPAWRLYQRLGFVRAGEHGAHDLLEWSTS